MPYMQIRMKDEKVQNLLNLLMVKVPKLALNPMELVAQFIAGESQKNYLRGPRPERLGIKSGRLFGSISSRVSIENDEIRGHVGTNVVSPKGFNYPGFWEYHGWHGKPRPFLQPARDNTRNKWTKLFLDNFKKELLNWIRAKHE